MMELPNVTYASRSAKMLKNLDYAFNSTERRDEIFYSIRLSLVAILTKYFISRIFCIHDGLIVTIIIYQTFIEQTVIFF